MSESSAANPQTLGSREHDYALQSDLARMCLPSQFRDAGHRRLAWVNSICFLFLLVGLVGLKAPKVVTRPLSKIEEPVPVVMTPPPEQPKPEEIKTEQPQEQETPEEAPQVATVVAAANPAAVSFAVPVQGAVAVAEARFATPPPPPNYTPPKPTYFNPAAESGGSFPQPEYPAYAIRNRYQGSAWIELKVNEQGQITSVTVQRTSGYSILDEAAVNVVKNRWRFRPGKPRWLLYQFVFQLQ